MVNYLPVCVLTAIADAAHEPRPDSAEEARALWELVSVNPDALSSNARSIGLGVGIDHPLASIVTGALGATRHKHADFDVGGLSITAWLSSRAGTTPWLMTADAYRA